MEKLTNHTLIRICGGNGWQNHDLHDLIEVIIMDEIDNKRRIENGINLIRQQLNDPADPKRRRLENRQFKGEGLRLRLLDLK